MDTFKDKAGNELKAGDAVWFDAVQGITEILEIVGPGVIDKDRPGVLSLRIDIPFVPEPGKSTSGGYSFGFLLYTRNPRQEAKVDKQIDDIMKGQGKKLHRIS